MDFVAFLKTTGKNLQKARWIAKMTQEDVAARGLTYRYYQELERGQRNPTLKTLFTLAQILGTTVAALVETESPTKARARPHLHEVEANPPRKGRKPKQTSRKR